MHSLWLWFVAMDKTASTKLSAAADVLLALAAVGLLAWVIARDRIGGNEAAPTEISAPVSQEHWMRVRALGREVGDSTSAIQVVEFLDLECPGCRVYHRTVVEPLLNGDSSIKVSFRVVHFPLRSHVFARQAAIGSECAASQGAFPDFIARALENQARFSLGPWEEIATLANVGSVADFRDCMSTSRGAARVDLGRFLGDSIGVTGTPTILINGQHFTSPPSLKKIHEVAARSSRD